MASPLTGGANKALLDSGAFRALVVLFAAQRFPDVHELRCATAVVCCHTVELTQQFAQPAPVVDQTPRLTLTEFKTQDHGSLIFGLLTLLTFGLLALQGGGAAGSSV